MYHDRAHMRMLRELLSVKKKKKQEIDIYLIILSWVITSLVKIEKYLSLSRTWFFALEYLTED